jgi:hypothetical protein
MLFIVDRNQNIFCHVCFHFSLLDLVQKKQIKKTRNFLGLGTVIIQSLKTEDPIVQVKNYNL